MTQILAPIKSGFFETPGGLPYTPTGAPMKVAVDNPYLTKDSYILTPEAQGLGINASSPIYITGELDNVILRASAMVNRLTQRFFDSQTIDEIKTHFTVRPFNPRMVTVFMNNAPLTSVNSVYIQVLQWFVEVLIQPQQQSYVQIQPEWGTYKIVPMLSSAGAGAGTPIPAQIIDHIPLGNLWTNYNFGFGQPFTGVELTNSDSGEYLSYQSPVGYRLWATPDNRTFNVYVNGILIITGFSVEYVNGIVTFNSALLATDIVTVDFTTNESMPYDIKEAVIMLCSDILGKAGQNPLGAKSVSILSYNVSFGDAVLNEVKQLLAHYQRHFIGFL